MATATLTATEVDPTPPEAPATVMISPPLVRFSPPAAASTLSMAAMSSSSFRGELRNSFAPARIALRINCPSACELMTMIPHLGRALATAFTVSRASFSSLSISTIATSGAAFSATSGKRLYCAESPSSQISSIQTVSSGFIWVANDNTKCSAH